MLSMNTLNKGSSAEPLQYHSTELGFCPELHVSHSPLAPFHSGRLAVLSPGTLGHFEEAGML